MRVIIRAVRQDTGKYVMQADNGDLPQEGREHDTAESVYADCACMWAGATWSGRRSPKLDGGYIIDL